MRHLFLTILLAVLAAVVLAAPATIDPTTPEDKTVDIDEDMSIFVEPTWEVQPYPGAAKITLNGTVEKVYAELLKINPNYDDDWALVEEPVSSFNQSFVKLWHETKCSTFGAASRKHIKEGIKYLRKVKGQPGLGNRPDNKCGRSYDNPKYLDSFGSIADAAQYVLDECYNYEGMTKDVSGTVAIWDSWRTLVHDADC
ncbi:hypothetical protein BDW62DRAFT_202161 [Aspergillus aurantiobrunneus]